MAFGAVFLATQMVAHTTTYAPPEVDDYFGVVFLSTVLGAVWLTLFLGGAIAIVRAKVASGVARWAFFALSVVAILTGVIANGTDNGDVATVATLCSTGAQIVEEFVLVMARSSAR